MSDDDEPPLADFWLALEQAAERWLPPDRFQVFIDHIDKLFMQWDAEDKASPSASVVVLLRGRITAQSSMRGELTLSHLSARPSPSLVAMRREALIRFTRLADKAALPW